MCLEAILAAVTVSSPITKYATRPCMRAILVENLVLGSYRLPSMLPDHAILVENLVLEAIYLLEYLNTTTTPSYT